MKISNIPLYRFIGYTDAWELRKIFEIADRFNNLRVPIASSLRIPGSTPYYGANGIQDYVEGYTHNGEFVLIAEDGANDLKNYPVNLVNGKIWVNNHAHVLQGKENITNNKFLAYSINRANIEALLVGSGRAKLNSDVLMNIELEIPSLKEQSAIGTFFSTLDQHITLHQRKLDTLKEQKKTYLKLLFPAKGKNQPALRFRGFEDDWKEVKLGEIVVWEKGSGLSKSDLNIEDRGGKVIHYADLYRYKEVITEIFHSSESIEGKAIPLNSLLFPMSDVTPQGLARASSISIEGVRAGGDILIANIKDNSSIFLSYQVNANYRYILPLVTGTTVRHISSTSLSTIPISLPTLPEQEAIGTFFQTLDQAIALVEDKLASLKEMKKALLRKLFVS